MSRILRIKSCGDCPYSDTRLGYRDVEKYKLSAFVTVVTKQETVPYYYCEEMDRKPCQEGNDGYQGIPEWCPLEKE